MQHSTIKPQYSLDLQVINLNKEEAHNYLVKRIVDVVFSLLVIVLLISWLYPILAILIKLESPGPVIFKQKRTGKDNADFWCYKFRSMKKNEHCHSKQACRNDDRITKIGYFLRRSSLDELPQFFNVLIGNMSVVGPRPHMLKHTELYRHSIDNYMSRHYMKPGITGWAQINGLRGETQQHDLMERRVQHDIWYLENWTASLDIKIIMLTIFHVLKRQENVY